MFTEPCKHCGGIGNCFQNEGRACDRCLEGSRFIFFGLKKWYDIRNSKGLACSTCKGSGLNWTSRATRVAGISIIVSAFAGASIAYVLKGDANGAIGFFGALLTGGLGGIFFGKTLLPASSPPSNSPAARPPT